MTNPATNTIWGLMKSPFQDFITIRKYIASILSDPGIVFPMGEKLKEIVDNPEACFYNEIAHIGIPAPPRTNLGVYSPEQIPRAFASHFAIWTKRKIGVNPKPHSLEKTLSQMTDCPVCHHDGAMPVHPNCYDSWIAGMPEGSVFNRQVICGCGCQTRDKVILADAQ